MAPHDWLAAGYASWLLGVAVWGQRAQEARLQQALLSVAVLGVLLGFRSGLLGSNAGPIALYRLSLLAAIQLPYFLLRDLIPAATSAVLDESLYRVDLALFGGEPSLWMDRLITPGRTEWFAFFYFSYFMVLAVHTLPILFLERRARLAQEFATGMVGVFALGQLCYFMVPGYGPYLHLADLYQNPLPVGFWMDLVLRTVQSGGALLDIFPSLHTAGPLYIALFSFRHRALRPFRYTWPLVAFFSANIILATLYLRWHYGIDVLAGIALAAGWLHLAPRLVSWHRRRLVAPGASWPALAPWAPKR
jgi:hypothetical protein